MLTIECNAERWARTFELMQAIRGVADKYSYRGSADYCWDCSVEGFRQMTRWVRSVARLGESRVKLLALQKITKEVAAEGFFPLEKTESELAELTAKSQKVITPEFSGFWAEVLEIFSKEGIKTEDFLREMSSPGHHSDGCLDLGWIIGWLYQNIR